MSGGRVSLVTVPPVRRVPPLLEESFIPGGRVIRSCRRMEKRKKKGRNETEIRLNRHRSSWPDASTATDSLAASSLYFLLSATRFERPDDDFTRYPLLYFCFGLSLFYVGCHSMTGWNIVDEISRRAAIFFSRLHSGTRVITSFQLLFPR